MEFSKSLRALVLAPHTDDGELGMGGTIARMVASGCHVSYVAFSVCEQSVPYGFSETELERELYAATGSLGLPTENVHALRYQVRHFPEKRQEILQYLIDNSKIFSPDIVFIPSMNDLHQDHEVIAKEAARAFKRTNIFCYELPWNNLNFTNDLFIRLSEKEISSKVEALSKYKTQEFRPYFHSDYIRAHARMRGVQISAPYAEVFEVVRMVW
jgi:LmbE family N-acetylglucosaminyl deacetylase